MSTNHHTPKLKPTSPGTKIATGQSTINQNAINDSTLRCEQQWANHEAARGDADRASFEVQRKLQGGLVR